MMLKKLTIYIVLAVLCPFLGLAQGSVAQDVTLKGVQIGQKVPEVMLSGLHNYKDAGGKSVSFAKLSDFAGKLLILDFWATWCSPCVSMIPRMDSLQRVFGDRVAFLSVSYQSDQQVMPFLDRLEKQQGRKFDLPVLNGDKVLHGLFPHVFLPHYVWIDGDGVVRAITDQLEVNQGKISAMLVGKDLALVKKKDFKLAFDESKPMLINGNGGDGSTLAYHSLFAGYVQGLGSKSLVSPSVEGGAGFSKISIRNLPIGVLYNIAFGEGRRSFVNNRMLIETADSAHLVYNPKDRLWSTKNSWCYELVLPLKLQKQGYELMRQDLDRFFSSYDVRLEKRMVECYALVVLDPKAIPPSGGGEQSLIQDGARMELKNLPLATFVQMLQLYYFNAGLPLVDATGYALATDIVINAKLSDVTQLNQELKRYGLGIEKGKREIEMIVHRDAK